MAQETTQEFSYRFNQAVEGHPMAPASVFGRQSWLLGKLKNEMGLVVSANTMSKWFNGQAMPRADNVRKIAQALKVDEVWLSLGRKPIPTSKETPLDPAKARGAVLALAGMLEMQGARVAFPDGPEARGDLIVNFDGQRFSAFVVTPNVTGDIWSYIVTEPVGDTRVLSVTDGMLSNTSQATITASLSVVDLTDCPRQSLGGYSVIALKRRKDGTFKAEGQKAVISALPSLAELAGT